MGKDLIGEKPGWMYRQSGVIPIIKGNGDLKTVLVTSTSNGEWVFPKGVIEKNMSEKDSALKEAFEEAGLKGEVFGKLIGTYEYEKWSGVCNVNMYLMNVEEIMNDWEDKDSRKREIIEVEKAMLMIENEDIKSIFRNAIEIANEEM